MICKQCGAVFEAKRSTAKYCSVKCRKLALGSMEQKCFDDIKMMASKIPSRLAVHAKKRPGVVGDP